MCRRRLIFTTRLLIISVALVALNLAGVIGKSKYYPKPHFDEGVGWGDGRIMVQNGTNGDMYLSSGHFSTGFRLERVLRVPPPPTRLQTWSPVIASVSVTLLVLALFSLPRRWLLCCISRVRSDQVRQFVRLRVVLLWLTIAFASIGLNFAAILYRGVEDPAERWLAQHSFLQGNLILKWDGTTGRLHSDEKWKKVYRGVRAISPTESFAEVESGGESPALSESQFLPGSGAQHRDAHIGTIEYRIDGGIVAYEGPPGEALSRPYVIRPPLRSFLEMRWPIFSSALITLLALCIAWFKARLPGHNPSDSHVAADRRRDPGPNQAESGP
jgi:hypothetical protein